MVVAIRDQKRLEVTITDQEKNKNGSDCHMQISDHYRLGEEQE